MLRYSALIASSLLAITLSGCSLHNSFTSLQSTVIVGGTRLPVYVADTDHERSEGLGSTILEAGQGMVFVWPQPAEQTFWMKDVEYPIDIVWSNDQEILGYVTAQPELAGTQYADYQQYPSPGEVDMVLELPAGTATELGLKPGDKLVLDHTLDAD